MNEKPKYVTIISDNGGHYHNTELMIILSHWQEWYNICVNKWIFLEAGEAKTAIDSHHAQVYFIICFLIANLTLQLLILLFYQRLHMLSSDMSNLVMRLLLVKTLKWQLKIYLVLMWQIFNPIENKVNKFIMLYTN